MKKEEVEVYSDASNMAVICHPGRNFPGSLIQGDSLHCLITDLKEAKSELRDGKISDAEEALVAVIDRLEERMTHYIEVLNAHGKELPF